MGAVAEPPDEVQAHLALSATEVIHAVASPGQVCVTDSQGSKCHATPAGQLRSVGLAPWSGRAVLVLELEQGGTYTWYFQLPLWETEWTRILSTQRDLMLTGTANPEGDSLQLVITAPTRPVEGWLWYHTCPFPGVPGFLQPISGPWTPAP